MSGSYDVQNPLGGHWHNKGAGPEDSDSSWRRTLLVSTPFLLIGLSSIFATYLPYNSWQVVVGVMVLLVLFGALGVAWIKGFPRWSYPYVIPLPGIAILGLVVAVVTGELINLSVTVAFLVTVAIALGLTRSIRPLWQLVERVWQDWTLLAFGLYGLLGLALSLVFDDAHYNNETPYYALAVLAGVVGALLYLRSHQNWQRMAALLGAVTLVVLIGMLDRVHFIGKEAFTYQASGWILNLWLLLMILISAPAFLIGFIHFLVDFLADSHR